MGITCDDKLLSGIEGVTDIRPISRERRPRRLLVVSRPRRRLSELSDSEIERWAAQIVDDMALQIPKASADERGSC